MFPDHLDGYEPPRVVRPRYKKQTTRNRLITEMEMRSMVETISNDRLPREKYNRTGSRPVVAAMLELAWMLGLRFGEVRRLLKTDFNAKQKSLRVVRWKTGNVSLLEYLPDRAIDYGNAVLIAAPSSVAPAKISWSWSASKYVPLAPLFSSGWMTGMSIK